jgi:hypothetical protein
MDGFTDVGKVRDGRCQKIFQILDIIFDLLLKSP